MLKTSDIFNSDFINMTRRADKVPTPPRNAPDWAWRIYDEQKQIEQKQIEQKKRQAPSHTPAI